MSKCDDPQCANPLDIPPELRAELLDDYSQTHPNAPPPGARVKSRVTGKMGIFIGITKAGQHVVFEMCDEHQINARGGVA